MNFQTIEKEIVSILKTKWENEPTGHDFFHLQRVVNNAKKIHKKEGGDLNQIVMIAWLHDSFDSKIIKDLEKEKSYWNQLLKDFGLEEDFIKNIFQQIEEISFRNQKTPSTIEGKIVQDADRLDALGAIGIARTFAYGGNRNRPIYDNFPIPEGNNLPESESTLAHFYEKLFLLKDLMNTQTAKRLAKQRHQFMKNFIEKFYEEWNGVFFDE